MLTALQHGVHTRGKPLFHMNDLTLISLRHHFQSHHQKVLNLSPSQHCYRLQPRTGGENGIKNAGTA